MTFDDFTALLKSVGVPMAYNDFDSGDFVPDSTPYLAYQIDRSNSFYADGIAYYTSTAYTVTLYDDTALSAASVKTEQVLTDNHIAFEKEMSWQSDEKYYITNYTMEV